MTTIRTTLVAVVTTLGLVLGLVAVATATATPASAASKVKLTPLKAKVRLQVKASKGAVLYSSRTGKVVRDRKDRARRIARTQVKTYTHRARIKGREYRRIAGTRYIVRLSTLRAVPKPAVRRPVVKPAPKPTPRPSTPKPPVVTQPPTPQPQPDPDPIPNPTVVRGPHNAEAKTLVFGDSNSMNADSWWAPVRDAAGTNFTVDAIGGTGFISSGYIGYKSIAERLPLVDESKPDFIVAAAGRNDWMFGQGKPIPTPEEQRDGIHAAIAALAEAAQRNNVPASRVYVMTPWGEDDPTNRAIIGPIIRAAATDNGFTFVDLPVTPRRLAPDGVHPNADGSRWLATQFLQRSDYAQRLAAWSPAPALVP